MRRTSAHCGTCQTTTVTTRNTSTLPFTPRLINISVTYLNPPPVVRTSGLLCLVRYFVEDLRPIIYYWSELRTHAASDVNEKLLNLDNAKLVSSSECHGYMAESFRLFRVVVEE